MAASTYPARRRPSTAAVHVSAEGRFTVRIAAADIGTGARTALVQIAAEARGVDPLPTEALDSLKAALGDA